MAPHNHDVATANVTKSKGSLENGSVGAFQSGGLGWTGAHTGSRTDRLPKGGNDVGHGGGVHPSQRSGSGSGGVFSGGEAGNGCLFGILGPSGAGEF